MMTALIWKARGHLRHNLFAHIIVCNCNHSTQNTYRDCNCLLCGWKMQTILLLVVRATSTDHFFSGFDIICLTFHSFVSINNQQYNIICSNTLLLQLILLFKVNILVLRQKICNLLCISRLSSKVVSINTCAGYNFCFLAMSVPNTDELISYIKNVF